eukprot:858854-Pelagomonas_calceolata.AAC.1
MVGHLQEASIFGHIPFEHQVEPSRPSPCFSRSPDSCLPHPLMQVAVAVLIPADLLHDIVLPQSLPKWGIWGTAKTELATLASILVSSVQCMVSDRLNLVTEYACYLLIFELACVCGALDLSDDHDLPLAHCMCVGASVA